jgi:hypothetical protein
VNLLKSEKADEVTSYRLQANSGYAPCSKAVTQDAVLTSEFIGLRGF